jgi:hypothetical protein
MAVRRDAHGGFAFTVFKKVVSEIPGVRDWAPLLQHLPRRRVVQVRGRVTVDGRANAAPQGIVGVDDRVTARGACCSG